MGQARRRGTYEERRAQAVERRRLEQLEATRAEAERLSAMTPEEREAEARGRSRAARVIAMAAGLAASSTR